MFLDFSVELENVFRNIERALVMRRELLWCFEVTFEALPPMVRAGGCSLSCLRLVQLLRDFESFSL